MFSICVLQVTKLASVVEGVILLTKSAQNAKVIQKHVLLHIKYIKVMCIYVRQTWAQARHRCSMC